MTNEAVEKKSYKGTLILLRGCPGAGKTDLANFMVDLLWGDEHAEAKSFSADDFFINGDTKEYVFDAARLSEAHQVCQTGVSNFIHACGRRSARKDFDAGDVHLCIVHNTASTDDEVEVYQNMVADAGWKFVSLVVENRHGSASTHNVPHQTIVNMRQRFAVRF